MSKPIEHPESMLPYGEVLKPLISSSNVLTNSDLKKTLSQKGIFTSSVDKEDIFPLLLTSLLSPKEYEVLNEFRKSRESTPKRRRATYAYTSDKELIRAVPKLNEIELNRLKNLEYENYEMFDVNTFTRNGSNNQFELTYKIKRTDLSKDWYEQVNIYEGSIEISLNPNEKKLNISTEHSIDEIKDINKLVVKEVTTILKSESMIQNERGNVIKFGDFSNEKRIKFLLNFVNDQLDETNTFEFDEITDIEISIDSNSKLPTDFQWMEDKISNIKFQGNTLHETEILKDTKYHSSLVLSSLKINYNFNINSGKGKCTFEIEFPKKRGKKIPEQNSEFVIKLLNIKYENKINTKSSQKLLNRIFDNFSEECLKASAKK